MNKCRLLFIALLLNLICISPVLYAGECLEERAVFDFGSGAIKAKYVIFDKCKNEIEKRIGEKDLVNKFADCLLESYDRSLSRQCISKAVEVVNTLQRDLDINCHEIKCVGVATAWARLVSNTQTLFNAMKNKNIDIKILSQKTEGVFGFKAAAMHYIKNSLSTKKLSAAEELNIMNNIFVIDIGAASFQFSFIDKGEVFVHNGEYGVVSFDYLLKNKLKHKNTSSPYLEGEKLKNALNLSLINLGRPIKENSKILSLIKDLKMKNQLVVLGIGSVFNGAIYNEMGLPQVLKKEHLIDNANKFKSFSIDDIKANIFPNLKSDYASTAQTSLISIHGIMEGASIDEITITNVSINDYILSHSEFWH